MKNKIAMWCMLFALLVALVPPSSARANITETSADDVKYTDIEDFLEQCGYIGFEKKEECKYFAYKDYRGYVFVYEFDVLETQNPYWCCVPDNETKVYFFADVNMDANACQKYSFYNMEDCAKNECYNYYSMEQLGFGSYEYYKDVRRAYRAVPITVDEIAYSDIDIYKCDYEFKYSSDYYSPSYLELLYENSISTVFTFPIWCEYAELSPLSSTNELPSKIPYSYNGYYHIVRKTSAGKWLLTTIGNSLGQEDVQVRFTEDNGALMLYNSYSGEDINGYMVNVRQYEYDTDGWKVRTYEAFDAREYENGIIELGAGTGVDSTRVMAYTNTDIYSYNGYAVAQSASTEYVEVGGSTDTGGGSDSGDSETEEPTMTPVPTTAPSGGGSSDDSVPKLTYYATDIEGTVVASRTDINKTYNGEDFLIAVAKGAVLAVHGWLVDNADTKWYYCTYTASSEDSVLQYTGYIRATAVALSGTQYFDTAIEWNDLDLKNSVTGLVDMVGAVPTIIAGLFSFLPPWCLAVVGVGFSMVLVLFVVKVIRG